MVEKGGVISIVTLPPKASTGFPRSTNSYICVIVQECTKLFVVKLPESRKFIVPKNLKLLAIPLCQINKNREVIDDEIHDKCLRLIRCVMEIESV